MQLDIAGIKVANAQFTWRDEKTGSTTALSNLDLGTGRIQADSAKHTLAVDACRSPRKARAAPTLRAETGRTAAARLTGEVIRRVAEPRRHADRQRPQRGRQARAVGRRRQCPGAEDRQAGAGRRCQDSAKARSRPARFAGGGQPRGADRGAGKARRQHRPRQSADADEAAQAAAGRQAARRPGEAKRGAGTGYPVRRIEDRCQTRVAKFAPLALGFDLDIDQLNVDKYLPPKTAQEKAAKEEKAAQGAAADKLDFSALKGLDIDGAIRIGALQVSKLKLAKAECKINIAGGRLDVAPLSGESLRRHGQRQPVAQRQRQPAGAEAEPGRVSINPLMKDLADKDLLEGRGNVALDVSSHGDSVAAMKKALGGTASLSLKDGAIKGINLAQSLRDIKGKLGAKQDTTQQAKAGDKTDFSELTASLKIANGVAHNEDLAMKSPFLRLAGAGDIDIGGGQMNYLAKASVVSHQYRPGGQGPRQGEGLTVPVRVTGPFEALLQDRTGHLAADAAKAKVEEKKQEVKAKAGREGQGQAQGPVRQMIRHVDLMRWASTSAAARSKSSRSATMATCCCASAWRRRRATTWRP
jgi:AsmA protein